MEQEDKDEANVKKKVISIAENIVCQIYDNKKKVKCISFSIIFSLGNV